MTGGGRPAGRQVCGYRRLTPTATSAVPDGEDLVQLFGLRLETPRRRRQRRALATPFPDTWRAVLEEHMATWRSLDPDARRHLQDLVRVFIADKRWEASRGFVLTDEIRVLIAAQACVLLLGLDHDHYRTVRTIIVHPSTIVLSGPRRSGIPGVVVDGPMPLLGQTSATGPVLLAWDAVRRGAQHPQRGHNVVYHEFAHRLDMLDGTVNGTPPLQDAATVERWVRVCTAVFDEVRAGTARPPMRAYAGVNPGEFFAVATETFFDVPLRLREAYPELYAVLAGFYRQDPAVRLERMDVVDPT